MYRVEQMKDRCDEERSPLGPFGRCGEGSAKVADSAAHRSLINERFVARLGLGTPGWCEGWVVEYRLATADAADAQRVAPTSSPCSNPSYKAPAAALSFAPAAPTHPNPDFGPENEPFAARLGLKTPGLRKPWVVEYRLATAASEETERHMGED